MTNDDIAQKLALLPEGLAEENLQTWQQAIQLYQELVSDPKGSRFKPLLNLVQILSISEQTKLFRITPTVYFLIISTLASERAREKQVHPFIFIRLKDDISTDVNYYVPNTGISDLYDCKKNEIMQTLQPLLDRLWNETRGKKNA